LTEVQHVPDIHKNLISVGSLEAKGYRVVIEAIVIKISREAVVFMKGTKHHNLYYPQGNSVTGIVVVAKTTKDTTTLWHMRLAHARETSF